MSKQYELSDIDSALLEAIELIVTCNNKERDKTDSMYGFCAHLSSTKPCAHPEFKKSLQDRLVAQLGKQLIEAEASPGCSSNRALTKNIFQRIYGMPHLKYLQKMFRLKTYASFYSVKGAIPLLVIIILCPFVFQPSLRAQVEDVIRKILLGGHTFVERVSFNETEPCLELSPTVDLDKQTFGAEEIKSGGELEKSKNIDTLSDVDDTEMVVDEWPIIVTPKSFGEDVTSVTTLEEAQAMSTFTIKAPKALPEGYGLREIRIIQGDVYLFYAGGKRDIVLVQTDVGSNGDDLVMVGAITEDVIKEIDLAGHKAVWVDHALIWEEDGVSWYVCGLDLTVEDAVTIAFSLSP